ncbi:MAG: TIGR03663 family protein [Anaerolineales bacterium]|uniref:TIGR03663 family protein n=1 Tax=Candidatus Desulfolinea nitratireducens TaxID=2841698 RepID=A0A8J6NJH8_9CHLR|nr:TIGR03663 family protein [Candidatus Desulfolinea nitratireducens]
MTNKKPSWLERPLHPALPVVTGEVFLFGIIIFLALLSRFYELGARVMSHDESLHTYFSWLLYKGDGYQHTPMMHGPKQFHLLALAYYLFGVNDFTARIPAALFSIATIWMVWYWRRYLGKAGALITALLMLISPYMLYYGRYVRNEPYSGFAGLLMLFAVLRFLEKGDKRYLFLLTISLLFNFTSKETAFIYTAQILLFLASYFFWQILHKSWSNDKARNNFVTLVAVAILLVGGALGAGLLGKGEAPAPVAETALPANPLAEPTMALPPSGIIPWVAILGLLALAAFGIAAYYLIRGLGWEKIRSERSFDLLMLTGTLVLPLLTPLISTIFGWSIPTTTPELTGLLTEELIQIGVAISITFGLSIALGLWWNADLYWKNALLFYCVFTVLFTTIFTNSAGFFTGLFGSLGYWLVQQEVARGSQPWYYYIFIQIPIYEFLPALGVWVAIFFGLRKSSPPVSDTEDTEISKLPDSDSAEPFSPSLPFALLGWWVFSSVLAYSYAGERMPWLTYHITLPMILLTGWGLNHLIKSLPWADIHRKRGWLAAALVFVFFTSFANALLGINGSNFPFQGKTLEQLQTTNEFLFPLIASIISAVGLVLIFRKWTLKEALSLALLAIFGLLALLTGRAAYRAAYINYDSAKEYLVYAHAARGVKDVMVQVEEISKRTTGDLSAIIAYDASAPDTGISWPFVWYLRDYTNLRSFDAPTRSLRDSVVIIVDAKNFDKIEPVVGQGYYRSDYIRMWWPNQDYYGLTFKRNAELEFDESYPCTGVWSILKTFKGIDYSRICQVFTNPEMFAAIFDIWANRDYSKYAKATGKETLTAINWDPSDDMRLYIRKDVAAQVWNYGVTPATSEETIIDPYQENTITLGADFTIGSNGTNPGDFDAPRGIAFAPDGSFYVADSRNHRIQHFDKEGQFINMWGQFGDSTFDDLPGGTLNEPWGVAVGPDGSVYVSDTWNHRIQKFDPDGTPITRWGHYGQAEDGEAFWGPRGIAVDAQGQVYVSDTGNKRIVIFDADGGYITEFGTTGMGAGEFDESVGVAVDSKGIVYVTDTWNQRVQSFSHNLDGTLYFPLDQWEIAGWYGQSLDNKPFISVDNNGAVFVTDPESYRILQFSTDGEFIRTWGDFGYDDQSIGLAAAVTVDQEGYVWVTDAGNHRVMRFSLPD